MNLAEVVQTQAKNKKREELGKLNSEVLFNKSCALSMAQMLVNYKDLEVLGRIRVALEEVNEAANRSCHKIRGLSLVKGEQPQGQPGPKTQRPL
jgi:hypothetical protein